MQPALDLAAVGVDVALAQRDRCVRALVTDREDLVGGADERDLDAVDVDRERRHRPARRRPRTPAEVVWGGPLIAVSSASGTGADVLGQLELERAHQPALDLGDADPADDVGEEAVDDEASGLVLADATRLQVEELLVVEAAGGRRVPGALDVTGLDLEVGDGVGSAAVGEHQVAVGLERLDAFRHLADQHVADPDGVRSAALQTTLVDRVALGMRLVVVDEEPVLDVLAGVDEVEPEHLDLSSGPGVLDVLGDAHQVAAEAGLEAADPCVAADPQARRGRGGRRRRPTAARDTRSSWALSPTSTDVVAA